MGQHGESGLFLGLLPQAEGARRLEALVQARSLLWGDRVRRRERGEDLHLTLHFLGAGGPESVARLRQWMVPQDWGRAPELSLKQWVHFPGVGDPRVEALAPLEVPPALGLLRDRLAEGVRLGGWTVDPRPFVPHVTLLRVKGGSPPLPPEVNESVRFDRLALLGRDPSGPARYRILEAFSLDR